MGTEGYAIDGDTDDEDGRDPPSVAHPGVLDGKVRVGLGVDASINREVVFLAVFTFGPLVVVVHQISNCVGAGHAAEAISKEG